MESISNAAAADRGADKAPPDRAASGVSGGDMQVLRKRADFLRAASARRQGMPGFLLQARRRPDDDAVGAQAVRIGYTCSKKLGNAVTRNRAKRRLRALAREVMPGLARPGWDYVLVGRPGATISRDYRDLLSDLDFALRAVHRTRQG